jgi:signal transduction histidine kinase
MQRDANPATVERAGSAIDGFVRQQERMGADLLDAARLRSGTVALDTQPTSLAPILGRALDMIAPTAEAKELTLGRPAGDLDVPVIADPDRLTQVFWNLLGNAVKFTPPHGSVNVLVCRHGPTLEVHVRDTGRGLTAENCQRVFQPYWQQQRGDGLGLGLMIARRLVELHGGGLSVTSPGPGHGADFVVRLPLSGDSALP